MSYLHQYNYGIPLLKIIIELNYYETFMGLDSFRYHCYCGSHIYVKSSNTQNSIHYVFTSEQLKQFPLKNWFPMSKFSNWVKFRFREINVIIQWQNSTSPSIAKENAKLSISAQHSTADLFFYIFIVMIKLLGKLNSDAFFL